MMMMVIPVVRVHKNAAPTETVGPYCANPEDAEVLLQMILIETQCIHAMSCRDIPGISAGVRVNKTAKWMITGMTKPS